MSFNPKYTVTIIAGSTKYNVTDAVMKLTLTESDGEIAQRANITLANVQVNGSYLSGIIDVRNRVFIHANDGSKTGEVFRGYVWSRPYTSKRTKELSLVCYDNLIYFTESEEYQFYSAGYSTQSICGDLCSRWGVSLQYNYASITHPKLPLRGNLADIFLSDLLEEVKKKTGAKYVMKMTQDVVEISYVGSNAQVYELNAGENTISASSEKTMQGMVTKVVILGKEDKDERSSVADTVEGATSAYGTLQKILSVSEGTTLADVRAEATELINEKGTPTETFNVTAVNIPWIRKGDKIKVSAGDMSGYFIVKSITHYGNDKTMDLEAERA